MSGDNNHNADSVNTSPDEPCSGESCGCGCGCEQCFCRFDHAVDNGFHRDSYGLGQHEGVASLPIDIATTIEHFHHMHLGHTAFEGDNIVGPNDARQLSQPLTHANINQLTHSYNEAGSYQEEWLRQYRMQIDEDPFPAFLSPRPATTDAGEMFDFEQEGVFVPMDLDGSMHVEESVHGDRASVTSRSTCPRSHSSRSASQVLAGMGPTPGFIFRPLPLLPDTLLPGVEEVVCANCGCEHE